jgi:1-phosphofructokinase
MAHLFTLTGNLLAETTAWYNRLAWNTTHRPFNEDFQVGGKGINVAKMAGRLGLRSTAVCFPGGHTGVRCLEWLERHSFAVAAFAQTAETRAGWVARGEGSETTFFGCDRPIEEAPWLKAIAFLEKSLAPGDILAICGSLPGWRPALAEPLMRLLHDIAGRVFVAVDTYGPPLAELTRCSLDLVKINRQELQGLIQGGEQGVALRLLAERLPGVKRWVITAGSEAVHWTTPESGIRTTMPPRVEPISPVGCGDVLLAGLLHGWAALGGEFETVLGEALRLAAANAESPGIADFPL